MELAVAGQAKAARFNSHRLKAECIMSRLGFAHLKQKAKRLTRKKRENYLRLQKYAEGMDSLGEKMAIILVQPLAWRGMGG